MNFHNRLANPSYLDPQRFLFDKSGALLLNKDDFAPSGSPERSPSKKSINNCTNMLINVKRLTDEYPPVPKKNTKKQERAKDQEDKLYELRDTADLVEEALTKIIEPLTAEPSQVLNENPNNNSNKKQINPISVSEFTEIATRTFQLFRNSVVFAERYKKWTDLQNACKHMLNCINSLIVVLPAISHNNAKVFSLDDLWQVLAPIVYIASESLIEMLHFNGPVDQSNTADSANRWYTDAFVTRAGCSLGQAKAIDDSSSIDKRFVKDFVFRSLQCLAACDKWEKLLSVAIKFNILTGYKYADQLSPLIMNAQHQVDKCLPHLEKPNACLEKLRSQLEKNRTTADLLAVSFKLNRTSAKVKFYLFDLYYF